MVKVWNENAVTPKNVSNHLIAAGTLIRIMDDESIVLHNPSGIPYRLTIFESTKHIRVGAWFELDQTKPFSSMLELESMINGEVFMGTASLNYDRSLAVWYAISYEHGMVADHVSGMVKRFGNTIQRIVDKWDHNRIIIRPLLP